MIGQRDSTVTLDVKRLIVDTAVNEQTPLQVPRWTRILLSTLRASPARLSQAIPTSRSFPLCQSEDLGTAPAQRIKARQTLKDMIHWLYRLSVNHPLVGRKDSRALP